MKTATLLVVNKPYQGDTVVENLLNYMINSPFADEDDIQTNYVCRDTLDHMIEDIYSTQQFLDMQNHRVMFHMILSTRPSKVACAVIDSGIRALLEYFNLIGYQAVLVPHYGSEKNCNHYHCHIAVNPISYKTGARLLDNAETYYCIVSYLNRHTCNSWSWRYTNTTRPKKS